MHPPYPTLTPKLAYSAARRSPVAAAQGTITYQIKYEFEADSAPLAGSMRMWALIVS